ncbi:MAG: peptidase M6 [Bacteroidetes bacterium]|nr:peptidase M6 [Bacteroidota bacterium]
MKKFLTIFCILLSFTIISWSQTIKRSDAPDRKTSKKQVLSPRPIDPQVIHDQSDMTWADYKPIPGHNWANPSLIPERNFKMALVAVDFSDQPFVITLPKKSDLFGNPQIGPIKREDVPKFYSDFWLRPSIINHGQTINGYWMEQSRGKFGITVLDAYGPYRMPKKLWQYGLNEWGQNNSTPDGSTANSEMEPDVDALWKAAEGDISKKYDAILRLYAGYDETGVWLEFGEMKFLSKEDIPAKWGNPDPLKPRWSPTRYVPWTSWKAGQMQWGISSIRQGENSGTITHELGHFAFDIGDNNNNPYIKPYRRAGSGPWDMMDRGSFNGPGGPHMRWVVPATMGAGMPAGLMLRNRILNGFLPSSQVLTLSRKELAKSGPVVATITARAVEPLQGTFAGIIIRLDGAIPHDRTPIDDPAINPLSSGVPNFDFYSLEVIQRIGYDSFCPDNGVLLAKNKDKESSNGGPNEFNCFNWVIDAHPEDINKVDYVKPDGTVVMRTIADYRQLNDALFHAGLNSGSQFEWEDTANRLHFYIIDIQKDANKILVYKVGIRSLDEIGSQLQKIAIIPPSTKKMKSQGEYLNFILSNTSLATMKDTASHKQILAVSLNNDIYRLSVKVEGKGWKAQLLNALAAVKPGSTEKISIFLSNKKRCSGSAKVTLTAISESNPLKTVSSSFEIKALSNIY